jgi:uncharacterized membrane protein
MSTVSKVTGLALAGIGLAQFAKPEAFESMTRTAFPDNTRQHIAINGGIETLLGVALATPRTRRIAVIGILCFLGHLGTNLIRNNG